MAQLMSIKKNVDVQPGVGVPAIFHCSQGDKGTRIILGLLNNNDNYTIPEDTTAIIRGSRADGTLFTEITADIDTTTEIKFNLTEDMTSVAGPVECEAVMTSGSANVIGTANFIIDVEKSPASIGSVLPGTDAATTWLIDELTNLDISGLDNESVVDAINSKANESTIAPEFDPSGSYTAGSYVYKNGVLYRFTAAHSAGAWTGTDVEAVTVGGEVTDLKKDLSESVFDLKSAFSEITQGSKNLLRLVPERTTSKGMTFNIDVRNKVSISGTSTSTNAEAQIELAANVHFENGKHYVFSVHEYTATNTLYVYLMSGGTAFYSSSVSGSVPFFQFTASAEADIDSIIVRYTSSGTTVNQTFYIQLEQALAPSGFVPGTSADDVYVTDFLNERYFRFSPIFSNGYFNTNGYPDTSTLSSFNSYIVTPELMYIKKGSMISPNLYPNALYVIVKEYSKDGTYLRDLYAGNLFGIFTFSSDCYARIAMRKTNYANIVPGIASDVYAFYFYGNGETDVKTKITFIGFGKDQTLSGQAILIRFPSGKNMLIDSHLLSYYSGFHNILKAHGVRRIDYYAQSHYHPDHCGLLNILVNNPDWVDITGATVFLPQTITLENLANVAESAQTLVDRQDEMVSLFEDNDCNIVRPISGQVDEIEGIKFSWYNVDHTVYAPNGSSPSTNYNDWSLCANIICGWNVINFSADIGPIGQRVVGGTLPKANILTAPHHGWDNGANNLVPAYINNVSPDVVISTNGWEHNPDNTDSPANINLATSAMQSYCEANAIPNYPTFSNGQIEVVMDKNNWMFGGHYTRYIRNEKNWKFNDNTDKQE